MLIVAGCGNAAVPSSPASPSVDPSVELPLDPGVLGVSCGDDGLVFHPALLRVAGHAETEPDAAAAALRAEILGVRRIPDRGWVRVANLADRVLFVAPEVDGQGYTALGFELRDGAWKLDVAGSCEPRVVAPAGVNLAAWRLDPAFPSPAAGDRLIRILITEQACASGRSPEGRVQPPIVVRSETAMTITILVTQRPGNRDCPGNPEFPVAVELPEPLGGRPLFDGGTFPPTGPIAAYALTCEVEGEACRTLAAQIVAEAERLHPGRRVAWLSLYDVEGGYYDLTFDDGTSVSRHP
jgi:hypothetical protein